MTRGLRILAQRGRGTWPTCCAADGRSHWSQTCLKVSELLLPAPCSIGATTMDQLKEDIDAFENVELDADTLAAIDAIHLQAR